MVILEMKYRYDPMFLLRRPDQSFQFALTYLLPNSNCWQQCAGSVKALDHDGNLLAHFKSNSKKPKLEYDGELHLLRLEGNCCFVAMERRRGGKILRLSQSGMDYEPKVCYHLLRQSTE